ncbi:MAG: FtsQ-type POTRA domain-containing protein [Gammaproteobacteria bacterium]|nr:FtsQ-type POTRA domain-containing protein [Gammaproteobacteria bacterium]
MIKRRSAQARLKSEDGNAGRSRRLGRRIPLLVLGGLLVLVLIPKLLDGVRPRLQAVDWMGLKTVKVVARFDHVTAPEIQQIVAAYRGTGFFDVDVARIREQIEAKPWVSAADVRRLWPDGLQVTVYEQSAVARWRPGGLVGSDGEVFMPERLPVLPTLPVLDGVASRSPLILSQLRAIDDMLRPLQRQVAVLEQDARGSWRVVLDDGLVMVLGRRDALQRLQRLVSYYPQLLQLEHGQLAQVDLRYSNGFVIRAMDATTAAPRRLG